MVVILVPVPADLKIWMDIFWHLIKTVVVKPDKASYLQEKVLKPVRWKAVSEECVASKLTQMFVQFVIDVQLSSKNT